MKKILASKEITNKDTLLAPSDPESAPTMEIEEEEAFCEGCAAESSIYGVDFIEEFIWHPAKKF